LTLSDCSLTFALHFFKSWVGHCYEKFQQRTGGLRTAHNS